MEMEEITVQQNLLDKTVKVKHYIFIFETVHQTHFTMRKRERESVRERDKRERRESRRESRRKGKRVGE